MEQTLIIFKPSAIQRALVGEILQRFERKGLIIAGMKMISLSEEILRQHYSHLVDKPFFPALVQSMQASPVIVAVLRGEEAISVVRLMTGPTNGLQASPGTIRGDYSMSNRLNILHASADAHDAAIEIPRFFSPDELFDYLPASISFIC